MVRESGPCLWQGWVLAGRRGVSVLAHQRTSLQNGERHFSEGLSLAEVK